VGPGVRRVIERDVAKKYAKAHQRERCREAHHDHKHDECEHQEPKCRIAHVFRSPPIPRWRALSSISCARSIAILRDSSSTYSLCASCCSMTSISASYLIRLSHSPASKQ